MKILAFDTSTHACTVALKHGVRVFSRHEVIPNQHTQVILSMMAGLLDEAGLALIDLDLIAFGQGPGSFTGVRIAASLAQGLAFGAGLPVVPVSTLETLAMGAHRVFQCAQVLTAWDARMGEVYWGQYVYDADKQRMRCLVQDGLFAPGSINVHTHPGDWEGVGNAWGVYAETLKAVCNEHDIQVNRVIGEVYPNALDMIASAESQFLEGRAVSAEKAEPVYLRSAV